MCPNPSSSPPPPDSTILLLQPPLSSHPLPMASLPNSQINRGHVALVLNLVSLHLKVYLYQYPNLLSGLRRGGPSLNSELILPTNCSLDPIYSLSPLVSSTISPCSDTPVSLVHRSLLKVTVNATLTLVSSSCVCSQTS